jgi:hypothetical protein
MNTHYWSSSLTLSDVCYGACINLKTRATSLTLRC